MRKFGSCREAVEWLLALRGWLQGAQCQQLDSSQFTDYFSKDITPEAIAQWKEEHWRAYPQQTRTLVVRENEGLAMLVELEEFFAVISRRVRARDWELFGMYHVHGRHQKTTYREKEEVYVKGPDGRRVINPAGGFVKETRWVSRYYPEEAIEQLPSASDVAAAWRDLKGERLTVHQVVGAANRVARKVEEELLRRGWLGSDEEGRRGGSEEVSDVSEAG